MHKSNKPDKLPDVMYIVPKATITLAVWLPTSKD